MIPSLIQSSLVITLLDDELFAVIAALLAGGLIVFFAWRSRSAYLALPELLPADARLDEDHVVIVPARNEEANIARTAGSFPDSLVLVIDDHSTDRTAGLARATGAEVRPAKPLEKGWYGKPNACWTGVLYTESKWIIFVDAGAWFDPGFVHAVIGHALRDNLICVSVFPKQEYLTVFEKLLLPYSLGLAFTGVDPDGLSNACEPESLASSQCLLVRRDAYEFVQGHKQVRGSLVDHAALARLFKQHRMPIRALRDETLAHAPACNSWNSVWRGLERRWLPSLGFNPRARAWAIASALVTASWLPVLVWLLVLGLYAPAALFFFVPAVAWRAWYGGLGRSMMAPLAIYLHLAIVVLGLVKSILGVPAEWKGRQI